MKLVPQMVRRRRRLLNLVEGPDPPVKPAGDDALLPCHGKPRHNHHKMIKSMVVFRSS